MINFLIFVSNNGEINEIKWSNPSYIVSMHSHSIYDIFEQSCVNALSVTLSDCIANDGLLQCHSSLSLKNENVKVNVCAMPLDNQILVFGLDSSALVDEIIRNTFRDIVHNFMKTIKEYSKNNLFYNNDSTRYQFEMIQSLNNNLINTRRMLEKANAQLNTLNMDLNNRLVKDALTGLVSRYQYRTEIEFYIASNPGKFGVFTFMDIDNFKSINDNYGHAAGDQYLVEFADRLRRITLQNTIKLRIAGDEFGLFTYGLDEVTSKDTENIWNNIKDIVLSESITINTNNLPISISAGMAIFGSDTKEIYELIEYADFAMYIAKKSGKNRYHVFNADAYANR